MEAGKTGWLCLNSLIQILRKSCWLWGWELPVNGRFGSVLKPSSVFVHGLWDDMPAISQYWRRIAAGNPKQILKRGQNGQAEVGMLS